MHAKKETQKNLLIAFIVFGLLLITFGGLISLYKDVIENILKLLVILFAVYVILAVVAYLKAKEWEIGRSFIVLFEVFGFSLAIILPIYYLVLGKS